MGELTFAEQDPDLVEFVEHRSTGTVHVMVHPARREAWWARYRAAHPLRAAFWPASGDEAVMTVLVMNPMPCVCGYLGTRDIAAGIDRFADERLCRSCWRATPVERRSLLFEHDVDDEPMELP